MNRERTRAEIYQILSECYKEPSIEFAEDVAQGHLYEEVSGCLAQFGIPIPLEGLKMTGEPMEVLQSLKEQYYPLFIGPFPPFALPVESVYKEWAREGETPLIPSGARGMLMGDPAIDMIRRYQASGIEIPKEFKDMPDHLSLLLEYMAMLCEAGTRVIEGSISETANEVSVGKREAPSGSAGGGGMVAPPIIIEEQKRFVREHLDWLPELRRLIYACTEQRVDATRFYRTVADATEAFVADEVLRLKDEG